MPASKPYDELLADIDREGREPFSPCAWYNPDGDSLEIYLSPEPHVAERVNTLFTVFVSERDRACVLGLVIKNIRRHFGPTGISRVAFSTGRASVSLLLFGALFGAEYHTLQRVPGAPQEPPTQSRRRIFDILEKFGDTEVTLQNTEALVS